MMVESMRNTVEKVKKNIFKQNTNINFSVFVDAGMLSSGTRRKSTSKKNQCIVLLLRNELKRGHSHEH